MTPTLTFTFSMDLEAEQAKAHQELLRGGAGGKGLEGWKAGAKRRRASWKGGASKALGAAQLGRWAKLKSGQPFISYLERCLIECVLCRRRGRNRLGLATALPCGHHPRSDLGVRSAYDAGIQSFPGAEQDGQECRPCCRARTTHSMYRCFCRASMGFVLVCIWLDLCCSAGSTKRGSADGGDPSLRGVVGTLRALLRQHPGALLMGALSVSGTAMLSYGGYAWGCVHLQKHGASHTSLIFAGALSRSVAILLAPFVGWLADTRGSGCDFLQSFPSFRVPLTYVYE